MERQSWCTPPLDTAGVAVTVVIDTMQSLFGSGTWYLFDKNKVVPA